MSAAVLTDIQAIVAGFDELVAPLVRAENEIAAFEQKAGAGLSAVGDAARTTADLFAVLCNPPPLKLDSLAGARDSLDAMSQSSSGAAAQLRSAMDSASQAGGSVVDALTSASTGAGDAAGFFTNLQARAQTAFGSATDGASLFALQMANDLLPSLGAVATGIQGGIQNALGYVPMAKQIGATALEYGHLAADALDAGSNILKTASQGVEGMIKIKEGAGAVVTGFGSLMSGASALVPVFEIAWAAITGPVGLVIGAIALVAGAAYLIYDNWDAIAEFFTGLWDGITSGMSAAWSALVEIASGAIDALAAPLAAGLDFIGALFTDAWNGLTIVFSTCWDAITLTFETVWDTLTGLFSAYWDFFAGLFNVGLALITGDWDGAWNGLIATFSGVWENLKGVFGGLVDWVTGLGDLFLQAGVGLVSAFWQGIASKWETLKEGFKGLLDGIAAFLPHSDADEGPLSRLTDSGRALTATFAKGITDKADEPTKAVAESVGRIRLTGSPALEKASAAIMPKLGKEVQPAEQWAAGRLEGWLGADESGAGKGAKGAAAGSMPPLDAQGQVLPAPAAEAGAAKEGGASIRVESGAVQITCASGTNPQELMTALEAQLGEVFARAARRVGAVHA